MQRIHHLLEARAARTPDAVFLHELGGTTTYAALQAMVDTAAQDLLDAGVRPTDRVVLVAENCAAHIALLMACSRVGAWSCGVNARMSPGEIAAIVERADARLCCFTTAASEAASVHAQRAAAQPAALHGVARSAVRAEARTEPGAALADTAAIIFTSGTSGTPKGVMVSHRGLLHFGHVSAQVRALGERDRAYAFLPMTHIFGIGTVLMAALTGGAALVLRASFSPADMLQALACEQVSNLLGPPTMYARLLAHIEAGHVEAGHVEAEHARPRFPHLRYVYTGSAPLDPALKQRVETLFGQPLHYGYGLSEYAGSVFLTRTEAPRADTAAGHAVEGGEARIVSLDGHDVPPGETGEIWLRGPGLMRGYFRDAEATAHVMRPGGWYASGDLGRFGGDGALFVVGRLKEMIIRSGFNVYPAEIEAVIGRFEGVHLCAVVGVPEADGNEQVIAFVELKPGAALDEAALRAHLVEHLSPYKRPSRIEVIDAMPTTANGKLLKRELQARCRPAAV
ncbi:MULTISPECIES: class I adenylate-forming enzyme family protein [unclassified Variovorax]|uniref:class I adenylate-forming enzyme family protein n=1 Tax=unclassified Variovorax TaxID=663243 RepID=UPI0008D55D4C|nr:MULTISPECIES: class I adenylate-forming enzyme family protein [unclassified Variovorax]SEJ13446.1 Acyl-CoA synthetase (AMP-forming)/AMP-acid ligase II [Variovorax sp. OK202]SFC03934.1 Acyl-CoA synthetase (AMP-forming)/AMP-acid ligase II [Variovorax sp. OK212]